MKGPRLKGRIVGFFDFESEIINTPHTGFLRRANGGLFQLVFNPILMEASNNRYYSVPPDIIREHDPNTPVQLKVSRRDLQVESLYKDTTLANRTKEVYGVDGIEKFNVKIPKPHIDEKDFLWMVSCGWQNAMDDSLDLSIALQLLSSPRMNRESIGGIGGRTLYLHEAIAAKKLKNHLKRTMISNMPAELTYFNPFFFCMQIESRKGIRDLVGMQSNRQTAEVSYNVLDAVQVTDLYKTTIPPTVPTIIENANPRKLDEAYTWDVVEWTLKAHMIEPVIHDPNGDLIRSITKELNENYCEDLIDLDILFDEDDVRRTARAMCRLYFATKFDEKRMMREFIRLIELTCDAVKEIREKSRDCYGLTSDRFSNLPKEAKILYKHIGGINAKEKRGTNPEELIQSLGDRIGEKKIMKSLKALREEGLVYCLHDFENIRIV
jgi:hypothetical protein